MQCCTILEYTSCQTLQIGYFSAHLVEILHISEGLGHDAVIVLFIPLPDQLPIFD